MICLRRSCAGADGFPRHMGTSPLSKPSQSQLISSLPSLCIPPFSSPVFLFLTYFSELDSLYVVSADLLVSALLLPQGLPCSWDQWCSPPFLVRLRANFVSVLQKPHSPRPGRLVHGSNPSTERLYSETLTQKQKPKQPRNRVLPQSIQGLQCFRVVVERNQCGEDSGIFR